MRVEYRTWAGTKVTVEFATWAEAIESAYHMERGEVPFRVLSAILNECADELISATRKTAKIICQ